jgi:hypothetical protein
VILRHPMNCSKACMYQVYAPSNQMLEPNIQTGILFEHGFSWLLDISFTPQHLNRVEVDMQVCRGNDTPDFFPLRT